MNMRAVDPLRQFRHVTRPTRRAQKISIQPHELVRLGEIGAPVQPVPVAEVSVAVKNVPFSFIAMPAAAIIDMNDIILPAQTVTLTSEDLSDNACAEQGLKDGTGGASGTCAKGSSPTPDPVCFP